MARRATAVNLEDRYHLVAGEPILDTQEGVLIIAFDDGASRTFNWDKVVDYYYMTEEEYEHFRRERGAE
ncbi:hypothetical protein SEA_SERENITY_48 [Mycobacterium phage Serenity]|uniref:hypothetical protein n=1 Tax=Mycobacterium phage Serenity TaxID=1701853 RepID=UPI0006CE317F|nr:hypothetical protein SEA_SERENITY_48 [Mycobacterium phage Serenity]ALF00915.1 hypothetical protein SEA_SERENITY_48 [Mycobacterium phage Serenity]